MILVGLAAAVVSWWVALFASPAFRALFVSPEAWPSLSTFVLADAGLAAVTAAAGLPKSQPGNRWLLGIAVGGWAYATAWSCVAASRALIQPLGAGVMLLALLLVAFAARALVSSSQTGRN